jgi:Holliday junction resolvase RusA-like endonuclease
MSDWKQIIIPGRVVPKQSVRFSAIPYFDEKTAKCAAFIKTYQTKEIMDYEKLVNSCCMEQLGIAFTMLDGAIETDIIIIYGIPKTMPKKDVDFIMQGGVIYKVTQPDITDNLIKGICDGMIGYVYENDGLICKTAAIKIYGTVERAIINIRSIPQRVITNTLV